MEAAATIVLFLKQKGTTMRDAETRGEARRGGPGTRLQKRKGEGATTSVDARLQLNTSPKICF